MRLATMTANKLSCFGFGASGLGFRASVFRV